MATMRAIADWFTTRRRVATAVLLGWVVLVVVGAGRTPTEDEWIAVPNLANIFLVALGVYAVIAIAFLVYFRPHRTSFRARRSRSLWALLLVTIFLVALAFLFPPPEVTVEEVEPEPEPALTLEGDEFAVTETDRPGASGSDIAALVLISLIVVAVLVRSRMRSAERTEVEEVEEVAEELLEEDIGSAFEVATDHLQTETDPRTAVIAAYASLERALAERGYERDPAQTPTEFLADVLAAMPELAGPAVRLGHLYELARFSDHAITNDDRNRAADALARARLDLVSSAGDRR